MFAPENVAAIEGLIRNLSLQPPQLRMLAERYLIGDKAIHRDEVIRLIEDCRVAEARELLASQLIELGNSVEVYRIAVASTSAAVAS